MVMRVELFDVLRAYASLAPLKGVTFPENLGFVAVHTVLLADILLNPHFIRYPPSKEYQATFWKWAIHHLEGIVTDEDVEIDPRIYEHYLALLPSTEIAPGTAQVDHRDQTCPRGLPLRRPPAPSYITHYWKPVVDAPSESGLISLNHYETITLLESRTTIESGTTGMRTWLASFVLSEYFIEHPDLVKNTRILELGSGIGFLGIILGRLQQLVSSESSHQALWLTDVNHNVLARCKENVQMACNNTSASGIEYRFLDWTDSQHVERIEHLNLLLLDEIDADLIVGADIIFDPSLVPALTGMLRLALQPGSTGNPKRALIAATVRNEETFAQFVQSAKNEPLQVQELPNVSGATSFIQDVDINAANVKIYQITL